MGLLKPLFLIVGGLNRQSINYILLSNCLHDCIVSCKTFEQTIENTSDHPVQLKINYYDNSCTSLSGFQQFTLFQLQTNWKICKVCSINSQSPDYDLCSACHVYPLSRGARIVSILFILNRFTSGLNYIV